MTWESIETAPKDGTHILVTHGKPVKNAPRHCYIARYMPGYNEWYLDGGGIISSRKLSHWMPLPEAPK
jgi:hypothetical protein